jgi:hypothetical protein
MAQRRDGSTPDEVNEKIRERYAEYLVKREEGKP